MTIWRQAAYVWVLILKMPSCDALFCTKEIGILKKVGWKGGEEDEHGRQNDGFIALDCTMGASTNFTVHHRAGKSSKPRDIGNLHISIAFSQSDDICYNPICRQLCVFILQNRGNTSLKGSEYLY